ncbi:sensor histidine kinase [Thermomonospora cellulosilytica]|uniref:histidine kinase n=1 Tax=Thermomonospora cellulosilytica TaxID=1411118 RepID=A0A7W3MU52_9ACTN|nr:HAMP domain-containing sensor histidine kinase [Thermomonospora cellulosilytica]MBA9001962.1 two-component system sensor histidine kinase MtrB [Thermomonospora cellulosilytica]
MRWPRRWYAGLRVRMVAAFTAVALVASVLASGIAYVLVRRAMLERTQEAVLSDVRQALERLVPTELPPDAGHIVARDLENALRTADGRVKAYAVPPSPDGNIPLPEQGRLHVVPGREFARAVSRGLVYQRVVRAGEPYLLVGAHPAGYRTTAGEPQRTTPPVLLVSVSLAREDADLRAFTRAMVIADAAALVLALGLALLATRALLHPVRALRDAARSLGAGRLEARVPVRGHDELADLARTFNRTAEALERTVTELRAKDAASRRFVADVSHELRTPLTSMIAAGEVLDDRDDTATRLVVGETRRLAALVEHLIEISRFDAGAAALVPDDVLVAEAVAATLDVRGWTDRVTVDGPAGLVARVDPRRLDVIVANLVGNALGHGRPPVRLSFAPDVRDGRPGFVLTVTDHGPGVPDDMIGSIFDRFVKAEAARTRSDGSGLGLSIARENARLHGGTLEAANAPGAGAVFTLWLPARPEHTS